VAKAEELTTDLREVVSGDGSDAVRRFGGEESPLFQRIQWAKKLKRSLDNGLRSSLGHVRRLKSEIGALPASGVPNQLRAAAAEHLATIDELLARDSFFDEGPAIAASATVVDGLVVTAIKDMTHQQEQVRREAADRWTTLPELYALEPEDREWTTNELSQLEKSVPHSLDGLRELFNHDYSVTHKLRDIEERLKHKAASRRKQLVEKPDDSPVIEKDLPIPSSIDSLPALEAFIADLQALLKTFNAGQKIRVNCQIRQLDAGHPTKAGT
jgi:hypothetical protein